MLIRPLRLWLSLLALVFTVGCFRAEADGSTGPSGRDTEVLITAQFQKRILGATGWSGTENRPARYCWAEIRQDSNDEVVASGYLDGQGQGKVRLPLGQRVYLMVHAAVEVPGSKGTPAGRGSVKLSKAVDVYADEAAFKKIPDAFVLGQAVTVSAGSSLSLVVPSSTTEAGAFNIADQIATFHSKVDLMEEGLVKLPSVHAFWSTDHIYTDFPYAVENTSRKPLLTDDPHRRSDEASDVRTTFLFPVRRGLPGGPDAGADAFNDAVIQQSLCHLLFASYSYSADGTSLLRRDNDDAYLSRNIQSEPAVAFVSGFSDFLSCAFRGSSLLQDIDTDGTVRTFYLDRHNQFPMVPNRGEFYSGAIAVSLYNTWKNVLGGGNDGLFKLYDAIRAKNPGEYENTILAAYPSYLTGLKNLVPGSWNAILGELSRENISDLTQPGYLNSGVLWQNQGVPFFVNGSIALEDPKYYMDWIAQKTYRIVHSGTANRRLTLTYPSGRDMYLELYSPAGLRAGSYTGSGATSQQIDIQLTPGEYLVRVRAGFKNTAGGTWNFSLSLN